MPDPAETNPIVALATRIRARQDLDRVIDQASGRTGTPPDPSDVTASLAAFATGLREGAKRLNAILGSPNGVKYIQLERPLRIRLRFRELRVTLDVDESRQLVLIAGAGFDGEYQFAQTDVPALINLSKLSTEEGYREPLTASSLLKTLARDAELPRPAHLDEGPLKF